MDPVLIINGIELIKPGRREGRPGLIQIRDRRSYDMTQAMDVQSGKIRIKIIKFIKPGAHIQTAPVHSTGNIIPGRISRTAVVGVLASQMRRELDKSNLKRVRNIIVRI